ncbi:MAG: ABC transporter permease [Anaerolineales bacterium]|nr:MAG: ABC transporter permease [Anaerolineales bacterium]
MKQRNLAGPLTILLFLAYMFLPILATYVFSIAVRWDRSILPEGLTLEWYKTAFQDRWFLIVFRHSITISAVTVLASALLIVPTAYWVHLKLPRALPLMNLISTLPFAIPAVVLALGLIKLYGQGPLQLARTPAMLVLAYVIFTLPFMYRPVASSLEAIDIRRLTEAAQSLGASWLKTLAQVILPNILPGILSGGLLVFATIFGEFTLATLLVGARYKTFPMQLVYYTRRDGRIASAYSVISFTVAWALSLAILWIATWGSRRSAGRRAATSIAGEKASVGGKV